MRRSILLTFIALGVVLTTIGGTGLFAALSDTTRTGTNSVGSAAMSGSADLQMGVATFSGGVSTCGTFSDDLASGLFTLSNAQPGMGVVTERFCLRNTGSSTVTVSARIEELDDRDVACTGDEALSGDTSCGAGLLGELSDALDANYFVSCGGGPGVLPPTKLKSLTTPAPLGTLAPGAEQCFMAVVHYQASTPATIVQKAQSDSVTWRYAFTGTA